MILETNEIIGVAAVIIAASLAMLLSIRREK